MAASSPSPETPHDAMPSPGDPGRAGLAMALGLMLSPLALEASTRGVGWLGPAFLAWLIPVLAVHLFAAAARGEALAGFGGPAAEARLSAFALGRPLASLPLACRWFAAPALAAWLLPAAREGLGPWLPAGMEGSLLPVLAVLAALVLVHLASPRAGGLLQQACTWGTLAGVAFFTLAGFATVEKAKLADIALMAAPGGGWDHLALALFLFLGHDLAGAAWGDAERRSEAGAASWAIIVSGVLLTFWAFAAWIHAGPQALAEWPQPWLHAAALMGGPEARLMMAVVGCLGALAGLGALLGGLAGQMADLGRAGYLPSLLGGGRRRALILTGTALALCLAWAGVGDMSPDPWSWAAAGAALWLWGNALTSLAAARAARLGGGGSGLPAFLSLAAALGLAGGAVWVACQAPSPAWAWGWAAGGMLAGLGLGAYMAKTRPVRL